MDLKIFRRVKLRLFLSSRAAKESGHAADIAKVLGSSAMFSALFDSLDVEYATAAAAASVGTPFTDFLDWLIANGPVIIAMIVQIIALFG